MTKCERRFARYSKRQLKKHNIRVIGSKLKFTSKKGRILILDDIENTENIGLVITPDHFKKDDISVFKTHFTHLETKVGARDCLSF